MKKLALVLVASLLLSACQKVEAPVEVNASGGKASIDQEVAANTPDYDKNISETTSVNVSESNGVSAPMPEEMPKETSGAIDLPNQLAAKSEGWTLDLLTPAQYTMTPFVEGNRAKGFPGCDVFLGEQDGKVTLFNVNGKQISKDGEYDPLPESDWRAIDGTVMMKKDGQAGLVDASDGKVLIPFKYDIVYAVKGANYYCVEKDKTQQLLRKDDLSVVYTLERGDRFYAMGDDREVLYQNSTLKIFDKTGAPVKNLVCDDVRVVAENTDTVGVNRLAVQEGQKWALYDGDGEMLTNAVYDEFSPRFKGDYIAFRKTGKWGIMDYSGKITIKPKWDDILLYDYSASLCLDNRWTGTMALDQEPDVTQPIYDDVGPYSESGFASFEKDGKYGLLDEDGNVMMTPRQSGRLYPGVPGFEDGVYLVEGDNGRRSFGVFADGQLVIPRDNSIYPQSISGYHGENESYNLVYTPAGKWGYIDGQGQYVIDTKFEEADGFFKGRDVALAKLNGKICLIDRKGNVVLETAFDSCSAVNPDSMVFAMGYTGADGVTVSCLVKLMPQ